MEYLLKNIFILTFLFICIVYSLSNTNNIFKRVILIKIFNSNILYYWLWHSWLMFTDPYRVNSIIYANIYFKDNTEIMQDVFNPYKGEFLGGGSCIRDVKYIESILGDTQNHINASFLTYLKTYFANKFNKPIKQIYLVQEKCELEDFYSKTKRINKKKITKFLCGLPNNDINKFNR